MLAENARSGGTLLGTSQVTAATRAPPPQAAPTGPRRHPQGDTGTVTRTVTAWRRTVSATSHLRRTPSGARHRFGQTVTARHVRPSQAHVRACAAAAGPCRRTT